MSKSQQARARARREVQRDVHADEIERSLRNAKSIVGALNADHPLDDLDDQIEKLVEGLLSLMSGLDPIEVIEQSRLYALPWNSGQPKYQAGIENGFVVVELLAIVARAMVSDLPAATPNTRPSKIVQNCVQLADELLELAIIRPVLAADPNDPLAAIRANLLSNEIVVRGSSYSELLEATSRALFGDPAVDTDLRQALGFGVDEALRVLLALHDLQVANMNQRKEAGFRAMAEAKQRFDTGARVPSDVREAVQKFDRAINPTSVAASVSVSDLSRKTRLAEELVSSVLDAFTWTPHLGTGPLEHVLAFSSGDNPLRSAPIVRTDSGRALLVHPVLTQRAVLERLEMALRGSDGWERYQKHRGEVLESRTRLAFESIFPQARSWHSLLYYVPSNEIERSSGPQSYSQRVESDHLIINDDVAIVIEDKAVALSPQSRGGAQSRLKKDLTGIITKASQQADRLVARIKEDHGIQVHGEGWVDLSHVREIHTVAVSLEDLTSMSTATADLVNAGLISTDSVPWTVSIHDLDLIVELTDRPADFLLYLRRRRHPLATVLYTAPDELDLFLYFLEAGLYVEEDPDEVQSQFPQFGSPTPADRQRWNQQYPSVITSRTDPLDAWYHEDFARVLAGKKRLPTAPQKPARKVSAIDQLVGRMDELNAFARTAIAATLLSGSSQAQRRMANLGRTVVEGSEGGTRERKVTIPIPTLVDGGWLLVWAVRESTERLDRWEARMRQYLRVKGHQMQVSRGALFGFDGGTGEMTTVLYEPVPADLTPQEQAIAGSLRDPSEMQSLASVKKTMNGQREQPRRKKRGRK